MLKRRHLSGFTLLEIMLVLVLLSLTAVMVVPTLPKSANDDAKKEAERFYQLIQLWNEQSLILSKVMGVRVNETDYSLLALVGNDWQVVKKTNRVVTSVKMPDDIKLELEIEGLSGQVAREDQLFSRDGLFENEAFYEEGEQINTDPPQLVLLGNGEIFPFELIFSFEGEALWKVKGTDIGVFTLASFDEDEE